MKKVNNYLNDITTVSDEDKIKVRMNVAGGVIMKDGDNGEPLVLLIRRAADDHFPLHYEFPRGKCDNGPKEKLEICAKREIKEECGLDVEIIGFIDKFSYLADRGTRKSTQYNYLCKMKNPNQQVTLSKEHDDFKWVQSFGEVELSCLPEIKKTIEKVFNNDSPLVSYPQNKLEDEEKINESLNKYFSIITEDIIIKSVEDNASSIFRAIKKKDETTLKKIFSKIKIQSPEKILKDFSNKLSSFSPNLKIATAKVQSMNVSDSTKTLYAYGLAIVASTTSKQVTDIYSKVNAKTSFDILEFLGQFAIIIVAAASTTVALSLVGVPEPLIHMARAAVIIILWMYFTGHFEKGKV